MRAYVGNRLDPPAFVTNTRFSAGSRQLYRGITSCDAARRCLTKYFRPGLSTRLRPGYTAGSFRFPERDCEYCRHAQLELVR